MRALALAVVLASGAAEARFAPRLDAPYRLLRVQEHEDARGARRFDSARQVIFTRTTDGYVARVALDDTRDSQPGSDYAMLAAALDGQAIWVELDRTGRLRRIRDLDAIWARLRVAIGRAATRDDLRLALWRLHDAATTAAREQVVAGVLLTALAPDDAERRPGELTVTLPSAGAGQGDGLTGTERVGLTGHYATLDTRAAGLRGTLSRRRVVDRRTGLLVSQNDEQRATATVAGTTYAITDRTTISLVPVS